MTIEAYKNSVLMLSAETRNPSAVDTEVGNRAWDILNGVKNTMHAITDSTRKFSLGLYYPDQTLNRTITSADYMTISKITVFMPLGLNKKWLEYIPILERAVTVVESLEDNVLKPTKLYVNQLLANPEKMRSVTLGMMDKDIRFNTSEIDSLKKAFSEAFTQGVNEPLVPYSKAFARNNDWIEANLQMQKLSTRVEELDNKKIIQYMDELSETLDKLMVRMRVEPEVYALNNITADTLGNRVYNVAVEVEFMAAVKTYVQAAQVCMADTVKKLKSNLR